MTPEVLARVFDPFYTTKPLGKGTGLGLSMIYGFAKQSGGQVRLYSEVGQGTTAKIYLPRHQGKAETDEDLAESPPLPRASAGETVLVVDDEPTIRMLVADTLGTWLPGDRGWRRRIGPAGPGVRGPDRSADHRRGPPGRNERQTDGRSGAPKATQVEDPVHHRVCRNAAVANGHLEPGMHVVSKPFPMEKLATRIRTIIEEA